MKTLCTAGHDHDTKQAARACDAKLLGRCLAVMAWARDKLEKEITAVEEDSEHGIYTPATLRAVAHALDVLSNPRLKCSSP